MLHDFQLKNKQRILLDYRVVLHKLSHDSYFFFLLSFFSTHPPDYKNRERGDLAVSSNNVNFTSSESIRTVTNYWSGWCFVVDSKTLSVTCCKKRHTGALDQGRDPFSDTDATNLK